LQKAKEIKERDISVYEIDNPFFGIPIQIIFQAV